MARSVTSSTTHHRDQRSATSRCTNVVVTDPKAGGLLHAGDSGHKSRPRRIDHLQRDTHGHPGRHHAGHYLNTACVTANGADPACASATSLREIDGRQVEQRSAREPRAARRHDGIAADGQGRRDGHIHPDLHVGERAVTNGVITDVLPAGLTYVAGSATSNTEFTFVSYNPTTRTLTWTAANVTENGTVTYKAQGQQGRRELAQPLHNMATIDLRPDPARRAASDVFVPVIPLADDARSADGRHRRTTDRARRAPACCSSSRSSALILVIGFVTPVPALVRRRNRR